jgi:hypothetical protein
MVNGLSGQLNGEEVPTSQRLHIASFANTYSGMPPDMTITVSIDSIDIALKRCLLCDCRHDAK